MVCSQEKVITVIITSRQVWWVLGAARTGQLLGHRFFCVRLFPLVFRGEHESCWYDIKIVLFGRIGNAIYEKFSANSGYWKTERRCRRLDRLAQRISDDFISSFLARGCRHFILTSHRPANALSLGLRRPLVALGENSSPHRER